jgi:plastocyanin/dipeptidyl aminopeptidase/acylaminoacyl peptidase
MRLLPILLSTLLLAALPAAASAANATVTIPANTFAFPAQVTITTGEQVTWNFESAAPPTGTTAHNIVVLPQGAPLPTGPQPGAVPEFRFPQDGASFSKTFATSGTFNYFCSLHFPGMSGQVKVDAPGTPPPPPPPPTAPLPPEPIAVGSNPAGANTIDLIALKGSETSFTKLTTNGLENLEPAWSYDAANRQVAYQGPTEGGRFSIFRVDADGSDTVNLTPENTSTNIEPSWSPDSFRIAFASSRTGNGDIYVMDFDGSHVRRLTNDAAAERHPTWSPDGKHIAFASDKTGVSRIQIMDVDPNGTGLGTNVHAMMAPDQFPLAQTEPDWSPVDANKIVYTQRRGSGAGDPDVQIFDLGTTVATPLTGNFADDEAPTWAPDGSKVIWQHRENGNQDLVIANTTGSDTVKQITKVGDARIYATPAWQPAAKPAKARPVPPPPPPPPPAGGEPEDTRPDPGTAPDAAPFVAIDPPHRTTVAAFRKLGLPVVVRCTALDKGALKLTVGAKAKRKLKLPGTTLAKAAVTCDPATKRATVLLKPGKKVAKALGKGKAAKRPLKTTLRVSLSRGAATLTDKLPIRLAA